ncbi:MAG: 4Fe-4S binding protein [bacterium]
MAHFLTDRCTGCTACAQTCPTAAISGIRKERHVIQADYCVDCGTCGRICPYGAVQDEVGRICARVKRSAWLKPKAVGRRCVSCNQCAEACPFQCLEMQITPASREKRPLPVLARPKACVGCGQCVLACPLDYLRLGGA